MPFDLRLDRTESPAPEDLFHRRLRDYNGWRLSPRNDAEPWRERLEYDNACRLEEALFLEAERERVRALVDAVPTAPKAFLAWFERLEQTGPGQHDPLFDWLAHEAPKAAMTWFLEQELAGEAGFDDLVALTQVRMPVGPKLELARNYWDEMGRGHRAAMHGPMLDVLARELGISTRREPVWESLALANLMVGLASNRHLAYQSLGALGAIELTAPGRATLVNAGLKRLGIDGAARRYFALHATLDVKHSEAWNAEVLAPLVASDPALARPLAEGALLRLAAGARCFERYRRELGV